MRVAKALGLGAILAAGVSAGALAQEQIPDADWRTINRDLAATRYSPLTQIDRSNVTKLKEAWNYPLRSFNTAVPLVIEGTMYFPAGNRVVALDADTGAEKWVYTVPPAGEQARNASTRGVGYWPGEGRRGPRILLMAGTTMIALDAANGQPVRGFGEGGMVDVGVGYGGSVTIADNVAVIGAASLENPQGPAGNPRGFDVVTGRKLWEFDTTPAPGQPGGDTWGPGAEGRGGTNMWGFAATVDAATDTVYLPIAGPSHNYYGGDRPGTNEFGNSVVAVDLATGAYKWHFQTVHHDLWDIDMSHAGPLIPVRAGNGSGKALANVGKSSNFFVLDAADGHPVLPVEERFVPPGDVPTEYYHPTQPFPVNTPPLSRVSMTYQDIVTADDTTPEHAAACRAMWEKAGGFFNAGPYTPFMFKPADGPPRSTIQLPGGTGGVNWGGPAADPTTGIVYVNAQDTSLVGWVEKVVGDKPYSFDATAAPAYDRASVDGKGPFFSFNAPIGGQYDEQGRAVGATAPCYKPPWSRLTAVDANTGEIKWAVPLGFRAFDAASGQQLWETPLRANANANPMTYAGKSGRQFVAINAGGVITAYSLSE
jgi:quinoprotein glucose dehydrogenase